MVFEQHWPDGWEVATPGERLATFPSLHSVLIDDAHQLNTVSYGSGGCGAMAVDVSAFPPPDMQTSLTIITPSGEDAIHNAVLVLGPSEAHAYAHSYRAAEDSVLLSSWPRKTVSALALHVNAPSTINPGMCTASGRIIGSLGTHSLFTTLFFTTQCSPMFIRLDY